MIYDFNHSIIDIADDFYEAYKRCTSPKNMHTDEYGRVCFDVVNVPAIVNGAFAIELYLKSMSKLDEEQLRKRKHSIRCLYYSLEPSKRDVIREEIKTNLPEGYTFRKSLEGIDNAFVLWRYIHNKQDFGFGLNNTIMVLSIFLEVIRKHAKRDN